jgi:hypothetical protein
MHILTCFIHSEFFKHSMGSMDSSLFESTTPVRDLLSIEEIYKILDSYIEKNIPFAWAYNNLNQINLHGLYDFNCKNDNGQRSVY